MERGVIDRFEEEVAIIEINGGMTREVSIASLPDDAKIGDAIIIEDGEIRLDSSETDKRKKEIQHLMDELFE
jgi:hydrogenase maturation factor